MNIIILLFENNLLSQNRFPVYLIDMESSQTSHTSEDMKFGSLPIYCINLLNSINCRKLRSWKLTLQEIKVMEINAP